MKPILMLTALLASCCAALPAWALMKPKPVPLIVRAENRFAFDLFARLDHRPGNLFVSPYSLYSAVGMAFLGARGETEADIARVLHLDRFDQGKTGEDARRAFVRAVRNADVLAGEGRSDFRFHAANAIWASARYRLRTDYTEAVQQAFGGKVAQIDFAHKAAARARINRWVAQATAGHIDQLIGRGSISPRTKLLLTNAAYFRARWAAQFNKSATRPGVFHVTPSHRVTVPMMHQQREVGITVAPGLKILSLQYDGPASMVIILPDRADGLAKIEAGLTAQKLNRWIKAETFDAPVTLTLPRFATRSSFKLDQVLAALGMRRAFSHAADFSGIAAGPHRTLALGGVVQRAAITIDEKGTEAMAATMAEGVAAGGEEARLLKPIAFVANHPFLYIIRAHGSGAILFMGRVNDPSMR